MILAPTVLALTLLAGSPPAVERRVSLHPRITELWYHSAVLDQDLPLTVVLPAGHTPAQPSRVVVLLHGNGRHHRTLIDSERCRELLLAAPFATVLPNGRQGWYVDSPVDPRQAWQQALTEAIAVADTHQRFRTDAAGRGIAGWSMGGYGAAWYAVCFPGRFGALGTLIGCLDFPNADLPADQNHAVPAHFGPPAGWPALNPLQHVARLAGLRLWNQTARQAFDRTMNEHWDQRLTDLGQTHHYEVAEGGHTFAVVEAGLPGLLRFFAEALR